VLDVKIQAVQHAAPVVLNHKIANGNDRHHCFTVK
jgi:hypothetical protein